MRFEDIDPTLRAFIGNREAFRKLGFSSDNLYCLVAMSARFRVLSCFVQLKAQGKTFNLECGAIPWPKDVWEAHYREVCGAINSGAISQADMDRIWVESEVYQNKVDFMLALNAKGFYVPKGKN